MDPEYDGQGQFNPGILPVQTVQIICAALAGGVVMFAAVVSVAGLAPDPPAGQMLSLMGLVFGVASVFGRIVVPGIVPVPPTKLNMGDADASEATEVNRRALALFAIYQTQMIIGLAILEGAAFFNVIAYMLEGNVWSLGAAGGLIVVMLLTFPTRSRVAFWIENRMQYEE